MSTWWHVHRDDWHHDRDTVRGVINGTGRTAGIKVFQTVERIQTLIPPGDYLCKLDYWYTGKMPAYEIIWPWDEDGDGQPDRDRLLIHPANAIRNIGGEYILRGCLALGEKRLDDFWENARQEGQTVHPLAANLPGVTSSRTSVRRFMEANTGLGEFMLKITEAHS